MFRIASHFRGTDEQVTAQRRSQQRLYTILWATQHELVVQQYLWCLMPFVIPHLARVHLTGLSRHLPRTIMIEERAMLDTVLRVSMAVAVLGIFAVQSLPQRFKGLNHLP